jgi:hypothetical protein
MISLEHLVFFEQEKTFVLFFTNSMIPDAEILSRQIYRISDVA